jgi:SPOR domain
MADRYQDRNFMADDLDRGMTPRGPARGESDPLAELARLIGQNDPLAGSGRPAAPKIQPRAPVAAAAPEPVRPPQPSFDDPLAAAGPPPWVQRGGGRPEAPRPPQVPVEQEPQGSVHPVHRYAAGAAPQHDFQEEGFADEEDQPDPSRYDDTLFGQVDDGAREFRRDQGYSDDAYAFEEDGYDEGEDEGQKKRGGVSKIAMVLALAVIGTGGAFAYRALVISPRNGEPPIIRADNSPTKIIPAPADGSAKVPDRLSVGSEKMVSREETPVDVNTRSVGPRVVFPPLTQGNNPQAPPPNNVASNDPPPMTAPPINAAASNSGTAAASEPRRIKTFSVRGDQTDAAATPAASPPPTPRSKGRKPPASANASADAPMSLSPQASTPPAAETQMASANSTPSADAGAAPANGYLVQVSSQRSEADAQASWRALQTKFPDALGQRSPVIKRADVPEKGTFYRAMVGPFGTADEATQFCMNLKSAGGQCFVPKK